jgi:hypothetical protein
MIGWVNHTAHKKNMRNAFQMFVGKVKGSRLFRSPKKDNIKIYFEEKYMMVWTGIIWLRTETSTGYVNML